MSVMTSAICRLDVDAVAVIEQNADAVLHEGGDAAVLPVQLRGVLQAVSHHAVTDREDLEDPLEFHRYQGSHSSGCTKSSPY